MQVNYKRYGLYLLRWQASTPILAGVGILLASMGQLVSAIVANLIGGLIFFWVDRRIFQKTSILKGEAWEVQQDIVCADCGTPADRGYRLAKASNYDKMNDKRPEFRCHDCSRQKYERQFGKN